MKPFLHLILSVMLASGLQAQKQSAEGGQGFDQLPAKENAPKSTGERFVALQQVADPLSEANADLEELRQQLQAAEAEDKRKQLEEQIENQKQLKLKLRQNFLDTLGGVEAAEYEDTSTGNFTLSEAAADVVQPFVNSVRDATASPRELDQLRTRLLDWKERKRKAQTILNRIESYKEANEDPNLRSEFELAERFWEGQRAKCISEIGVLSSQIKERVEKQRPFWEMLSDLFSDFFRTKGLNLLYAFLTGVVSFLLVRKLYDFLRPYSPVHRKSGNSLGSRIADILAVVFAVLVAIWGVLLVFYIRGDWFLLTLTVLLLIGIVWASKTSIPPYVEQVRTLLNLGSIREMERVVYEGIPYEVKSLGFLTVLHNPALQGGEYRIPVRHVMNMISREPGEKEPWFPTQVGEWVVLADETYGKVVNQTPEQVVVLRLGGSRKTYKAADFLGQQPENLSHGYRISCTFGIDYQHQPTSTTEVPEIMERALTHALLEKYDKDTVISINVEFVSAGASSLDYQILVDVSGELASRYQATNRLIQKVCVDACNENGWVIPFTQITLHQASDKPAPQLPSED
ncbi:MAG: hypothetical protein R3242_00480 [Akkermansiaceae bacterium]|nr:hypothetical protein [Akkermansiaceae bacterium]